MAKRIDKEHWREFIDKFSYYEGTVMQYYLENNLSKNQFYYHKTRFGSLLKQLFMLYHLSNTRYRNRY